MSDLGDLTKLLSDESKTLSDLDWIDVDEESYRELERLPKQNLDAIPDLEEQWGLLSEEDRYRLSPENREPSQPNTPFWSEREVTNDLTDQRKSEIVEKFFRRHLQAGVGAKEAVALLRQHFDRNTLQAAQGRVKEAMSERGLLGTVYVDASLFPECDQGEGQQSVERHNKDAKFVLAKSKCADCVWASDGKCSRFQKELVMDVQYEDGLWDFYRAKAEALGKDLSEVSPNLPPKERIRQASLAPLKKSTSPLDSKPVQKDAASTISHEEAVSKLESTRIRQEVVENVYRTEKVRRVAAKMIQGNHGPEIRDALNADADLAPLKKHLHLLGNLYADLSYFETEKAASEALQGRDDLFIFGHPSDATGGTKLANMGTFNLDDPRVIDRVVHRYALVQYGPGYEDEKGGVVARLAQRLASFDKGRLRKFAQNVYAQPLPDSVRGYEGTVFSTPQAQSARAKVTEEERRAFKAKLAEKEQEKVRRDLRFYLKKEGGRDLLALLTNRFGLDTVKDLWLQQGRISSSVQEHARKEQAEKRVVASVTDPNFKPTGQRVILPEFFETRIGRWLRDRLLAGSTGSKLSKEIRQTFSESDIIENAPIILAMREEEGLLGRVYSMADSFDDCDKGKRAMNATVSQIVKGSKCSGCIYNKQCRCLLYGKDLTASPQYGADTVRKALAHRVSSGSLSKSDVAGVLELSLGAKEKTRLAYRTSGSNKTRMSDSQYTAFRGSGIDKAKAEKQVGEMLQAARKWLVKGNSESDVRDALQQQFGEHVVRMGSVYLDQVIERTRDHIAELVDERNIQASTGLDQMEDLELTNSHVHDPLENINFKEKKQEQPVEGLTFGGFTED